ncbi:MAG TPA: SDR family oxidoreductase [Opitutus sp.]|nr:SDR family oxidoreductase [Opitutus sp.]
MKILLTGASGLLGSAVATAAARRAHDVTGIVGRFSQPVPGLSRQIALDLRDGQTLARLALDDRPDAIVNCAAIAEPGHCDADPVGSAQINVCLPTTLARLAATLSARIVHISSEQVFDGRRNEPYSSQHDTNPLNLYGRQKLESEHAVLSAAAKLAAIVRAPLLLGDSVTRQRSLHERLLADWAGGRTPRLYTDELRQPCTAAHLADVLVELAERRELTGVFHWAGQDLVSRYTLGLRVRERFQLPAAVAPVIATTRADTPTISPQRPACLALDFSALAGRLQTRPLSLEQHLSALTLPPAVAEWFSRVTAGSAPQP